MHGINVSFWIDRSTRTWLKLNVQSLVEYFLKYKMLCGCFIANMKEC